MDFITETKEKIPEDYQMKILMELQDTAEKQMADKQMKYNMRQIMILLEEKQSQLRSIIEEYSDESSCISIKDKLNELRTQITKMSYQEVIEEIDLVFFTSKGYLEFLDKETANKLPEDQSQTASENIHTEDYLYSITKEIKNQKEIMETHCADSYPNSSLKMSSTSLDSNQYSLESESCSKSNNDSSWRPSSAENSREELRETQRNFMSRTNRKKQQKVKDNEEEEEEEIGEEEENNFLQQEEQHNDNGNITKEDVYLEEEYSFHQKNIKEEYKNLHISLDHLPSLISKTLDVKQEIHEKQEDMQFKAITESAIFRSKINSRSVAKPRYFETYIKRIYQAASIRNLKVPNIFVSEEYFEKSDNVMLNETERQFVFELFRLLGTVIKVEKILFLPKRLIKKIVVQGALALKKEQNIIKNEHSPQQIECIVIDSDDQDDTAEDINTHNELRHYKNILEGKETIQSMQDPKRLEQSKRQYLNRKVLKQLEARRNKIQFQQNPVKSESVNEKENKIPGTCNVKQEGNQPRGEQRQLQGQQQLL